MLKTMKCIKISREVAVQKTATRILRGRARQVWCEKQRECVYIIIYIMYVYILYIHDIRLNRLSELRSDARKVFARPTVVL